MGAAASSILEHLKNLVGLKLSLARRAADMRIFDFGQIRALPKGPIGEYALHIQCPWRLEGPIGIITGRMDLWEPADQSAAIDWDTWDYDENENLQDRSLGVLLSDHEPGERSFVNRTDRLVVEKLQADDYGGIIIELSGGYRLVLFPDGTRGEDWRIFRPGTGGGHFVVVGGTIRLPE